MLMHTLRGTWVFDYLPDEQSLLASLSVLLSMYPHLNGRMVKGRLVRLTDEGVPFNVQDMPDLTVSEVLFAPEKADRFSRPLKVARVKAGRCAPMRVTLTRLKDGGVLGVRCSHGCLDGMSFYTLMDNWSKLYRNIDVEPPVVDQSLLPQPSTRKKDELREEARRRGWRPFGLPAILRSVWHFARGTFRRQSPKIHIGKNEIAELRRRLESSTGLRLTGHEVVSALIMARWSLLFGYQDAPLLKQVTVMDCRGRVEGIPLSFAGNGAWSAVTAEAFANVPLEEMVRCIHEGLTPYRQTPSEQLTGEMQLGVDLSSRRLLWLPFDFGKTLLGRPTVIYTNNFCRAPVYRPDFGGGPPVCVIPHDLPDPVLIWPAPPDTGGVEIYFKGVPAVRYNRLPADHPFHSTIHP